jgi:hypothetical protein
MKIKMRIAETGPDLAISDGGAKGTRTPGPLLAKQVLFQLSYSPSAACATLLRVPVVAVRRGAPTTLSRYSGDLLWQLLTACCSWQLERMTMQQLVRLSSEWIDPLVT